MTVCFRKKSDALALFPCLQHLPAVAGWITEACIDGSVAFDRLLRELDAARLHLVIGRPAIFDDKHERRHRSFCDSLLQRLGRALIDAKEGESRTYTVPNGNTVKVTLVKAEPYHS